MAGVLLASLSMVMTFLLGQFIANSRYVSHVERFMRSQVRVSAIDNSRLTDLEKELFHRAVLYHNLIKENHLEDGMVVARNRFGRAEEICDSLLFSSLRYVALKKLGLDRDASSAWEAISASRDRGHWFRHPKCIKKGTSRDMVLGILAAFTQNPTNKRKILQQMISFISESRGFISHGRIDVSYLLPGVAELVRIFADGNRLFSYSYPANLNYSFSTIEIGAVFPVLGYRSHLIALSVWIEIELSQHDKYSGILDDGRNMVTHLAPIVNPFALTDVRHQRLGWISYQLFKMDPDNLFFRYLWLKSVGIMGDALRADLIKRLLEMDEFPVMRLPTDCDRKADYLWQRGSWEYRAKKHSDCQRTFSGVDFLWMAGILLSQDRGNSQSGVNNEAF